MKQFQFEVKNNNNLKKELARVKRFAKNENYSSIHFQIFTTLDDFDEIKELTDIIDQEFPDGYYYGCQTYGNIFEGTLSNHNTMIVCSVFEFDTTKAKVIYIDTDNDNSEYRTLQNVCDFCNDNEWVKGVDLITSYKAAEQLGVGGDIGNLREDVEVFGGIAINPKDITVENTFIFAKGYAPSAKAAIAIVVGGPDLTIKTDYVSGWEGLGKSFTVTDCDGRRISRIDNEPAMNIYKKYLNIEQDEKFQLNATIFPLLVSHDGIECIRVPVSCDNSEEFELMDTAERGMSVHLSYGEKNTILKQAKSKIKSVADMSPDSIRIYSCAARRAFWGDEEVGKETRIFDDVASTVGFYTRGELLRIGNYLHYFNSTMVIAFLREGEAYDYNYDIEEDNDIGENSSELGSKLLTYITAVTNELEGQFNSTMKGIASIYKSMFLIDMENREITQLDDDERGREILSQVTGFTNRMKHFLRCVVVEENLYQAMMFCDFNTLRARLRYRNVIDCELIGQTVGWFRAQFVVINRREDGMPTHFVFTTQVIDSEKKNAQEQQKIIQALADTYNTLHVFDLEKDLVNEVNTQDLAHKAYAGVQTRGCQPIITSVMNQMVSSEYLQIMHDFTDFSTLEERLADHKFITAEFHGKNGWAKAGFIDYEKDSSGKLKKVIFTTQIIDEEKKKEQKLIKRASIDEMTGLYNRRIFEEDMDEARNKATYDTEFVLGTLDLNGLKTANDTYGHQAGDELIIGAADCIRRCLSPYGKAYRTGGDEFAVLLYTDRIDLKQVLDYFEAEVLAWRGDIMDSMTVSFGYVESSEFDVFDIDAMIREADKRMYAAKERHYRSKGLDRRGQRYAYEILCQSYTKILKINLSEDTYEIIRADNLELTEEKGFAEKSISKWMHAFATSGQVHADDIDNFIRKTDLDYLRSYFLKGNKTFSIKYRRVIGEDFKDVCMEMMPSKEFSSQNLEVYLYVKDIS